MSLNLVMKVKSLLLKIFRVVDCLIPKTSRYCFYVTPRTSWDPNLQQMAAELHQANREYYIVDGNTMFLSVAAFVKATFRLMRSRVIIYDHSPPHTLQLKSHYVVNVWHGSPLKKIRNYLSEDKFTDVLKQSQAKLDVLVCASDYDRPFMGYAFGVEDARIFKGLPRFDLASVCIDKLKSYDVADELKYIESLTESASDVVLWAPTYRGESDDYNPLFELYSKDSEELIKYLDDLDGLFLVRSHKFSVSARQKWMNHEKVVDVSHLRNVNLLLRSVTVLVTDYSSIWIDFLPYRRPILFYAPDYETYNSEHGFIVSWQKAIPASAFSELKELISALRNTKADIEIYQGRQESYFRRYFRGSDGDLISNNTLRLIDKIDSEIGLN